MISTSRPSNFDNPLETVGCFVEHNNKILLLHRHSEKPEGNTWCSPGGKIDPGEDAITAIQREVREETGINAQKEDFHLIETFYVTYPNGKNFIYHKFRLVLNNPFDLVTQVHEHQDFIWCLPGETTNFPLIQHEGYTIEFAYKLKQNKF